jgi:CpeT protein
MRYFVSLLLAISLVISLPSAAQAKKHSRKTQKTTAKRNKSPNDIDRLYNWMSGNFSSQQQALKDSDYFDVRLHMAPIWKERSDGHWLYIEQALAEQKPFRQRVYNLILKDDTTFECVVYVFKDPSKYVGEWEKPIPLAGITPDSLLLRDDCSLYLYKKGDIAFVGGTIGTNCQSDQRGTAYTTIELTISKDQVIRWDRGYDKDGTQVWGVRKGGYVFKKF